MLLIFDKWVKSKSKKKQKKNKIINDKIRKR